MRFITIASGKGGVGRTTLTANLGIALAKMGKPTTIIDASLTTPNLALLFRFEKVPYALNDVLEGNATLEDVIYDGPGGVKVVPAAVPLSRIQKTKPENLPAAVRQQPAGTQFVLIDAPGGLRLETVAALRSGREILLVTVPEMMSVSDVMKTRIAAEIFGLKPIGVVLNCVQGDAHELTKKEIGDIMNLKVLAEIPYDKEVRVSMKAGAPLLERKSKSPAAKAITKLAKTIAGMKVKN